MNTKVLNLFKNTPKNVLYSSKIKYISTDSSMNINPKLINDNSMKFPPQIQAYLRNTSYNCANMSSVINLLMDNKVSAYI